MCHSPYQYKIEKGKNHSPYTNQQLKLNSIVDLALYDGDK